MGEAQPGDICLPKPARPTTPHTRSPSSAAPPASAVLAGKSCGSCTVCCKVMGVPELKKRPWDVCPHVATGQGCTIYAERPPSCRKFICGWLMDPHMGPELKPENCHVVFFQQNEQNIIATCDADFPGAWRRPDVVDFLHHLARQLGPHRKVILMEKAGAWIATEDAIRPADTG
jgi:hypothetical protein